MPLQAPNLDDRTFQDILDEARRRIPQYCPEWTDHNLSDPGITLLELFAWMTELLLYQLNRVPEKNYITFLELMGIHLEPAHPARTDLTFRLTAPQPEDVTIPVGTSVATLRSEADQAVTFATDRDIPIRVPRLAHVLACWVSTRRFYDYLTALEKPREGLGIFSDEPQPGDAVYLGFATDLSAHTLALTLRCPPVESIGIRPDDPPLVWETWDAAIDDWNRVRLEADGTRGFNQDGVIILETPGTATPTVVDGRRAFWLRCRVTPPRDAEDSFKASPRWLEVKAESLGGSGPASHSFTVYGEELGTTDGTSGQTFRLGTVPVLPRRPGETLEVQNDAGQFEPWIEVPDLAASGPTNPHFVLDDGSGTIEFGPRIRNPRGEEREYGRIPPLGRKVRFSRYRSGGGTLGNVGAGTLTVLKTSIPYVAWVKNNAAASGGTNSEDLEHAKWRAPRVLRATERAVTAEDFEVLARAATSEVARARCLPVRTDSTSGSFPGTLRLLIVRAVHDEPGPIRAESLQVPEWLAATVKAYLDERRLLTFELSPPEAPRYTWITVEAQLRVRPSASPERVQREATAALYRFIHPTMGGPEGQGWPFGRELVAGELYPLLQSVDGVSVVEEVLLREVDLGTGREGAATTRLTPSQDGLLCSAEHRVTAYIKDVP